MYRKYGIWYYKYLSERKKLIENGKVFKLLSEIKLLNRSVQFGSVKEMSAAFLNQLRVRGMNGAMEDELEIF